MGSDDKVDVEEHFSNSYDDHGNVRLFINLGKKDKLTTSQLVKLIASSTSLSGKQIGKIDMLDKFSFFEIPESFVDEVIEKLSKQKVKGRKINLEVANKKKGRR
jgi:ATP-dependent RNA helicase DeaD